MEIIYNKIGNRTIIDSEIIREMESSKNESGFNINWKDNTHKSLLMYAVLIKIQHSLIKQEVFLFLNHFLVVKTLMLIYKVGKDGQDYILHVGGIKRV